MAAVSIRPFAETQLRRRRRAFRRKHWRFIVLLFLSLVLAAIALAVIFSDVHVPVWLAVPGGLAFSLVFAQEMFDGTYHLSMGREAEKWTSRQLKKASGPDSTVIDWVPFDGYDVDHVLVSGAGVYAIETKYTDSSLDLADPRWRVRAQVWVDQAYRGARSLRFLLGHTNHEVAPVVIVWGTEMSGMPTSIEGVPILRAKDLEDGFPPWASAEPRLGMKEQELIVSQIEAFRAMRLSYERKRAKEGT